MPRHRQFMRLCISVLNNDRPSCAGHNSSERDEKMQQTSLCGVSTSQCVQAAPSPVAEAPGIAGVTTYQVIGRDSRLPVPDVRVYPFRWACPVFCGVVVKTKPAVHKVHLQHARVCKPGPRGTVPIADSTSREWRGMENMPSSSLQTSNDTVHMAQCSCKPLTCTLQDGRRDPVLSGARRLRLQLHRDTDRARHGADRGALPVRAGHGGRPGPGGRHHRCYLGAQHITICSGCLYMYLPRA